MSRILASWSLFLVLIKIFSLDCETFCFHKVLYIVGTKLTTKKIGKAIFGYFNPGSWIPQEACVAGADSLFIYFHRSLSCVNIFDSNAAYHWGPSKNFGKTLRVAEEKSYFLFSTVAGECHL